MKKTWLKLGSRWWVQLCVVKNIATVQQGTGILPRRSTMLENTTIVIVSSVIVLFVYSVHFFLHGLA